MKRTLPVLLCLCLLLSGCTGGGEETVPSTTETTAETTTETTVETTVETTAASVLYRHPLNGSLLEEPFTGRATAVVINNIQACLPQHGISGADMIYELVTEGGITRLLAIFSDLSSVGNLGPVRSSRSFFNNISAAYDAPIIHCGGSQPGINGHYNDQGQKVPNWAHINEQNNGSYFFRDQGRRSSGYALEHTLFTNGEKLLKGLADKGFNTVYENGIDHGLQFSDDVALTGETANSVTLTFKGTKTTTMTYNADTGLYEASQYKKAWIDANTGDTLTFNNVLALYTKQWQKYDGHYYRSYYTLIGEGEGYFACGGQIIPIKWSREALEKPFVFTTADGSPVSLEAGTTYVGVVSADQAIRYE